LFDAVDHQARIFSRVHRAALLALHCLPSSNQFLMKVRRASRVACVKNLRLPA
jgi:hypothetical protein